MEKVPKVKLALVGTHDESIEPLVLKLKEYHKEKIALNNKVEALVYKVPEGSKY